MMLFCGGCKGWKPTSEPKYKCGDLVVSAISPQTVGQVVEPAYHYCRFGKTEWMYNVRWTLYPSRIPFVEMTEWELLPFRQKQSMYVTN